jgi:hypothetical protein
VWYWTHLHEISKRSATRSKSPTASSTINPCPIQFPWALPEHRKHSRLNIHSCENLIDVLVLTRPRHLYRDLWSSIGYELCELNTDGVWIGNRIVWQFVSSSSHNAIAESRVRQFTTARAKSSQSAMSSLVVAW